MTQTQKDEIRRLACEYARQRSWFAFAIAMGRENNDTWTAACQAFDAFERYLDGLATTPEARP